MSGCDSCGAQVRRDDKSCPICGAPIVHVTAPHIPVRRFGDVPPYPIEYEELLEEHGPGMPRRERAPLATYALAVSAAAVLAACGYWLR